MNENLNLNLKSEEEKDKKEKKKKQSAKTSTRTIHLRRFTPFLSPFRKGKATKAKWMKRKMR